MINLLIKFVPNFLKKKIMNYLDRNYLFVGWNLKTKTCPPWKNTLHHNKIFQIDYFNDLNDKLIENINKKKFIFNKKNQNSNYVKQLKWRHYNVLLSLKYLNQFKKDKINLVEAGVADGLTAWFVLEFLNKENISYQHFTLIDSWEEMKSQFLKKNEYKQIGRYEENNIEITKINLKEFEKINFLKGFIPNIYKEYKKDNPKIDWLHIDLNSSIATKETLEFFSDKLNENSVIVFDDYGWPNHEESRIEIDKWSLNKNGILWPLPTGQAVFFNF